MTRRRHVLFSTILLTLALACGPSTPNAEKIKSDLIGRLSGSIVHHWKFDSLSEFESFKIVGQKTSGDITEYTVETVLKDLRSGQKYAANLLINYRKEGGEWKFVDVSENSFDPIQ